MEYVICTICTEALGQNEHKNSVLPCGHTFHRQWLVTYKQKGASPFYTNKRVFFSGGG